MPQKLRPEPLEERAEFDDDTPLDTFEDTTQDALPPTLNVRIRHEEPDTVVMPIEEIEALNRCRSMERPRPGSSAIQEGDFEEEDTDTDRDPDPWAQVLAKRAPKLTEVWEDQPVYRRGQEATPVTTVERCQPVAPRGIRQILLEGTNTAVDLDGPTLASKDPEVEEPEEPEEESEYVPLPSGELDRIDTSEEALGPGTTAARWVGPLIILVMLLAGASAAFVLYSQTG